MKQRNCFNVMTIVFLFLNVITPSLAMAADDFVIANTDMWQAPASDSTPMTSTPNSLTVEERLSRLKTDPDFQRYKNILLREIPLSSASGSGVLQIDMKQKRGIPSSVMIEYRVRF